MFKELLLQSSEIAPIGVCDEKACITPEFNLRQS